MLFGGQSPQDSLGIGVDLNNSRKLADCLCDGSVLILRVSFWVLKKMIAIGNSRERSRVELSAGEIRELCGKIFSESAEERRGVFDTIESHLDNSAVREQLAIAYASTFRNRGIREACLDLCYDALDRAASARDQRSGDARLPSESSIRVAHETDRLFEKIFRELKR